MKTAAKVFLVICVLCAALAFNFAWIYVYAKAAAPGVSLTEIVTVWALFCGSCSVVGLIPVAHGRSPWDG